jgi:hypothetical protein
MQSYPIDDASVMGHSRSTLMGIVHNVNSTEERLRAWD